MSYLTNGILRCVGMGSPYPEASAEQSPHLSSFGYPAPMQKLHKALRAALSRVPAYDQDNQPVRDQLLSLIKNGRSNGEVFKQITLMLGEQTAREDLIQKRISRMTPADFISDQKYATPNVEAVKRVQQEVIGPDNERFAKVPIQPGKSRTEWDVPFDLDDGPSH